MEKTLVRVTSKARAEKEHRKMPINLLIGKIIAEKCRVYLEVPLDA